MVVLGGTILSMGELSEVLVPATICSTVKFCPVTFLVSYNANEKSFEKLSPTLSVQFSIVDSISYAIRVEVSALAS